MIENGFLLAIGAMLAIAFVSVAGLLAEWIIVGTGWLLWQIVTLPALAVLKLIEMAGELYYRLAPRSRDPYYKPRTDSRPPAQEKRTSPPQF